MPIRVLIIDDVPPVRIAIRALLQRDGEIEVVGMAEDPYQAITLINELKPDVITLDIEMPRMDGHTFLIKLMRTHKIPVIIVSSLTENNATLLVDLIAAGAIDVMGKPAPNFPPVQHGNQLREKIKLAHQLNIDGKLHLARIKKIEKYKGKGVDKPVHIVCIVCGLGSQVVLESLISSLPENSPAVIIVQRMVRQLVAPFVNRLAAGATVRVRIIKDGLIPQSGEVYLAAGDQIVSLQKKNDLQIHMKISSRPFDQYQTSIDAFLESVAIAAGNRAIGLVLSCEGREGVAGLQLIKAYGGQTFAQTADSALSPDLITSAVTLGVIDQSIAIEHMAETILHACDRKNTQAT